MATTNNQYDDFGEVEVGPYSQRYERGQQSNYGTSQPVTARGFDFGQVKAVVADKLHSAGQMLQEQAGRQGERSEVGRLGQQAGAWFERSAAYVSDMEPQQVRTDLENQVRRNPGRSLLVAGAVGLVLGRLLRGR